MNVFAHLVGSFRGLIGTALLRFGEDTGLNPAETCYFLRMF